MIRILSSTVKLILLQMTTMQFEVASQNGHTGVVELLLKVNDDKSSVLYGKIDPAANDNYAIRWAS